MIRRLNRFAHTVDAPDQTLVLQETLQGMVDLCQRFAGLENFRLESAFPGEAIGWVGNAFLLQLTTFLCIEQLLHAGGDDRRIMVSITMVEATARIMIAGPPVARDDQYAADLARIQRIAGEFGATLEVLHEDVPRQTYVISLPSSARGA